MATYKCIKCHKIIGSCPYNAGIRSSFKFIDDSIPIGKGSGLYCEWICFDCAPVRVFNYILENQYEFVQGLTPWLDTDLKELGSKIFNT